MTPILALWATPRSTSTPFEWMMRERGDFSCHHEPFNEVYYYGSDRRSNRDADVPAKPGISYPEIWDGLRREAETGRVFVKDFAYSVIHMVDEDFLDGFQHTFLIRDPAKVLPSLYNHWQDFTDDEAGFATLRTLFDRICQRDGSAPPVISSDDLLDRTHDTVEVYCAAAGIDFLPEALTWDSGRREEVSWYDGGSWHGNLRGSTGITRQKRSYVPIDHNDHLKRAYDTCLPHYNALLAHKLPLPDQVSQSATGS